MKADEDRNLSLLSLSVATKLVGSTMNDMNNHESVITQIAVQQQVSSKSEVYRLIVNSKNCIPYDNISVLSNMTFKVIKTL